MTRKKSQKAEQKKAEGARTEKEKSIIKTTLVIHLSSHDHHPNQKHQSNDPESECSIPLRTDTVLFKPSQCIDGHATDVVVVDVAVAVGIYVALVSIIST